MWKEEKSLFSFGDAVNQEWEDGRVTKAGDPHPVGWSPILLSASGSPSMIMITLIILMIIKMLWRRDHDAGFCLLVWPFVHPLYFSSLCKEPKEQF